MAKKVDPFSLIIGGVIGLVIGYFVLSPAMGGGFPQGGVYSSPNDEFVQGEMW